ncbi:MAG: choline dehydrogenase, partial [Okeania sp. SIO3B3]|nr:choline dehydrogenase [Okeania sp. SIO3B3]
PPEIIQCVFRCLTKIPFTEEQVDRYVETYSKRFLLSEQHMAGGCLFGEALDFGKDDPAQTGKVNGSSNVHVADLSAVPLPRISPQMTAYLVGFHVAKQLYPNPLEQ